MNKTSMIFALSKQIKKEHKCIKSYLQIVITAIEHANRELRQKIQKISRKEIPKTMYLFLFFLSFFNVYFHKTWSGGKYLAVSFMKGINFYDYAPSLG